MSLPKRRLLGICEAIIFAAMLGIGFPSQSFGTKASPPGQDLNPCDHLPDPPGKAKGIEKRCLSAGSSSGIAKGDFNGDGFADLAIGVPGKDTPSTVKDSGAVIVIYGSANGLTTTDAAVPAAQFWSQNAPGIPGDSGAGDRFGSALASGDFNDDGFSDLAIGIPNKVVVQQGQGTQGRVVIIYGSAHGLTTDPNSGVPAAQAFSMNDIDDPTNQLVHLGASVPGDVPTDMDSCGSALAWGDFNADGVGDLAIGCPKSEIDFNLTTSPTAGSVAILLGSKNGGLSTAGNQLWTQKDGLLENPGEGDLFGAALTTGDFNGDGRSDLAVGMPGKSFGTALPRAGEVSVIYGSNGGLTAAGNQLWDRITLGVNGTARAGDHFGWSLAAGDFNGDGRSELAVGVPFDDSIVQDAGSVQIFFGAAGGLTKTGNAIFTENSLFATTLASQQGDGFGFAVAAGDFNDDGRADLAIGVPFQDFFNTPDTGQVDIIYGASTGLSRTAGPGSQSFHQSFGGVTTLGGNADPGDRFGLTLTAWNFGKNQFIPGILPNPSRIVTTADLAVGVPFEDLFSQVDGVTLLADTGAVNVIYGSINGLTTTGNQFWTEGNPGMPTSLAAGDEFGLALY